jgi:hypothetical protein
MSYNTQYLSEGMTTDELQHSTCQKG